MDLSGIHIYQWSQIIDLLNSKILWGPPALMLLLGTHLFLTFKLRFIQRYIFKGIKLSFTKNKSGQRGDINPFAALATALSSTLGTGNIIGVGTAIALGGPGAVFWCWLTGIFAIATTYSEALLAVKFRVRTTDGTMLGGPMYTLERGLKMRSTAILFAFFTALAALGIGNSIQANSVASILSQNYRIPCSATGLVMATITCLVIFGGIKSISKLCTKLVPLMALFYICGCLLLLYINSAYLLKAIALIVQSAFSPMAGGGGFIGSNIMLAARFGIARGLFTNEAGMGSAAIVAAAAKTPNAPRQALIAATATFWDTVVICALTGIVLVAAILANPALSADPANPLCLSGAQLTNAVFAQIPYVGQAILSIGLVTFAFSTILGWSYYGEKAVQYLAGERSIPAYRSVWVAAVFCGSVMNLELLWHIADSLNILMAIPNLFSLLLLNKLIVKDTNTYLRSNQLDLQDPTPIPKIYTKKF